MDKTNHRKTINNYEFYNTFSNFLNKVHETRKLPPFIGEFSDASEIPPDLCEVPFYCWIKHGDIIFSCNKTVMECFAIALVSVKQFVDVTAEDITQAVDRSCEVHEAAFTKKMEMLLLKDKIDYILDKHTDGQ